MDEKELVASIVETFPLIEKIQDEELRYGTIRVFARAMTEGGWTEMSDVPFTRAIKTDLDFVTHTTVVATNAVQCAQLLREKGIELDLDFVISGGLLHDVGKLFEYSEKKGHAGLVRHPFSGAALAMEMGMPVEIVHMIATHAGEGNLGLRSPESVIVHHCDFMHFECVKSMMGLK